MAAEWGEGRQIFAFLKKKVSYFSL